MNDATTAMFKSLTLGRLFGIRVAVDLSWIALFGYVTLSIAGTLADLSRIASLALGALCALLLFGGIVAHELAHALVARRFGVRTSSIKLFVFGGVATLESEPPSPRAEVLIALAGPAMSGVIAALAFGLLAIVVRMATGAGGDALARIVVYVALANGVLAAFNLIPAFPMDGGRVLRAAVWQARRSRAAATGAASLVGLGFAGVLALGGLVLAFGFRLWEYVWYTAIGAFVIRQSWQQLRESRRVERLERLRVFEMMEIAGDSVCDGVVPAGEITLASSASALDAVGVFRSGDHARIAVVDAGQLTGWLRRERIFAIIDRAA